MTYAIFVMCICLQQAAATTGVKSTGNATVLAREPNISKIYSLCASTHIFSTHLVCCTNIMAATKPDTAATTVDKAGEHVATDAVDKAGEHAAPDAEKERGAVDAEKERATAFVSDASLYAPSTLVSGKAHDAWHEPTEEAVERIQKRFYGVDGVAVPYDADMLHTLTRMAPVKLAHTAPIKPVKLADTDTKPSDKDKDKESEPATTVQQIRVSPSNLAIIRAALTTGTTVSEVLAFDVASGSYKVRLVAKLDAAARAALADTLRVGWMVTMRVTESEAILLGRTIYDVLRDARGVTPRVVPPALPDSAEAHFAALLETSLAALPGLSKPRRLHVTAQLNGAVPLTVTRWEEVAVRRAAQQLQHSVMAASSGVTMTPCVKVVEYGTAEFEQLWEPRAAVLRAFGAVADFVRGSEYWEPGWDHMRLTMGTAEGVEGWGSGTCVLVVCDDVLTDGAAKLQSDLREHVRLPDGWTVTVCGKACK